MGQMTHGILLGCQAPAAPAEWDDGWYTLTEKYSVYYHERPSIVSPHDANDPSSFIGYWVALGWGDGDIPPIGNIDLGRFMSYPSTHQESIRRAEGRWDKFTRWAHEKHKIVLPSDGIWLVETEVA